MKNTAWRNPMLLLLTAVIWGVAFVAQSVGMDYVGPFTFNFARCMLGAAVLIPCILFLDWLKAKEADKNGQADAEKISQADAEKISQADAEKISRADAEKISQADAEKISWAEQKKQERRTLLLGGLCCGIALFVATNLQQIGIQYTTVGKAGFITALYIVLVPILGIFLKKKVGLKVWVSVALAVAGLYLLCITDQFSIGKGDFFVLLCALVFSGHILIIDYFSPRTDGVRMSCIQFFVCGVLSGIVMLFRETPDLRNMLLAWQPIAYAGVMSCGVAYTLQIVGQKGTDPTIASLILSLESVVSVLAGWALLSQKLSVREVSGCVLMFAAIILAQLPGKKAEQKQLCEE